MTVAPFTVHRVNGLPVEALDVELPRTCALLAELAEIQAVLDESAAPLGDALYKLVPRLDDHPGLRRSALALRRSLHSGKSYALSAEHRAALGHRLGEEAELFNRQLDGLSRAESLRNAVTVAFTQESAAAGERLRELLDHPAFAQGLAHASPDLLRHLRPSDLRPGTKAARGVLAYASRAATKTSPFSRFTALALDGARADGSSRISVAQQHLRAWVDRLARDEECAAAFRVEPNRSACTVNGRPRLLVPTVRSGTALAWRADTVVDAALYADALSALASWPQLPVQEFLARLGGDDPFGCYLRLLDTQLIRVVLPWAYGAHEPLPALARALDTVATEAAAAAAATAREVQRRTEALGHLDGRTRLAAMAGLSLGAEPLSVYEDAVADVAVDFPTEHVQKDLRELAQLTRPHVFRSHLYDWMLAEFVSRHGTGGHCPDAYTFLMELASAPDFGRQFGAALMADRACFGTATSRAWLPVSASSAPPATTVLYQLSATDGGRVSDGDYRMVVNQFNPGLGGLVARFRRLLDPTDDGPGLSGRLRDWIESAFPDARPHEISLCTDLNSMQLDTVGILPPFAWPGEPPHVQAPAGLAQLQLRHEPDTNTLLLTDSQGDPVAPVYLGVVPAHLMSGPVRLLLCLADPWVNGAIHLNCSHSPLEILPPPGEQLEGEPARTHGRLMLRRRTWRLAPNLLPTPEKGEQPHEFFARMDTWRRAHQLPDEVFLTLESGGPMSDYAGRKPSWLSFRSSHAVLAAAGNPRLANATAIRLSEAVPARDSHWVRDREGLHRATEHVSLLCWGRPTPGRASAQGEGNA